MNKLLTILALFLAFPSPAQRAGKISWTSLFEIHDSPAGVLREAKITSRLFKRLPDKPNVWQRDMFQVREKIEYEWTEEIHLNNAKPESFIFITTDPFEFERLVKILTDKEQKDQFGTLGEGEGYNTLESKVLASGRKISRFSKDSRLIEVLSNNHAGIEEWIFQISRTVPITPPLPKDQTPPVITVLEPKDALTKSIGETSLSKTNVKIRVTDPSGVKSVKVDGHLVKLLADGTYSQAFTVATNLSQKIVAIEATDSYGNSSSTEVVLKQKVTEPITAGDQTDFAEIAQGRYYGLIISVQNYQPGIPPLSNPHKDSDSLAKVLLSQYKFNLNDLFILKDPTVAELGQALEKLKANLTKNDNLLIFFSGHGEWDERIGQGYWLLKDAEYQNQATWISNSTVKDYIRGINSRHTLLVTDACFGGSISKSSDNYAEKKIYKLPSRIAITSGNLEKVPDKSVFMKYFLERLRDNKSKYLPALVFFSSFYTAVISNSGDDTPHQPQYSRIDNTGHQGGDFIFSLK